MQTGKYYTFVNGTTYDMITKSYTCGSCKRRLSDEMVRFDIKNPKLNALLKEVFYCTFPDCGQPILEEQNKFAV